MKLEDSLSYKPVELSFGTSGLRGLINDMTDLECYINAVGFIQFLKTTENLQKGSLIYIAGDLRDSTPRIMAIMVAAIEDNGYKYLNCGKIPTPALAYYSQEHQVPCIMVTGSHIPADRNGIKFYKTSGELLKSDESIMQKSVSLIRDNIYNQLDTDSLFNSSGEIKELPVLAATDPAAEKLFMERFTSVFPSDNFSGKLVIVYQHSAVGRDFLVNLFENLGAKVVAVERSKIFIPIDTEHIREEDKKLFEELSQKYPEAFAIVSTDGDSDRPFVVDETGVFHSGDILGAIVADYLGAKFGAVPVSCNDAVDTYFEQKGIALEHTKIGSPYVIAAMNSADTNLKPRTSWESNGGFLLADDTQLNGQLLKALPTRDASLPILCALSAASQKDIKLSELFANLPQRYTAASLIDDIPPKQIDKFRSISSDYSAMEDLANKVFRESPLGDLDRLNITDGLRLIFKSGDVIHLRPSGNAPQFRVYSNADTQQRADVLADQAIAKDGYIEQLLRAI